MYKTMCEIEIVLMSLMHIGRAWRGSTRPQGTSRTPRTRIQICELVLVSLTCWIRQVFLPFLYLVC